MFALAEKNWTSPIWKWMNEPHRSRKESPERKPDPGRTVARTLPATRGPVHQPDQRARLGQNSSAGADASAHGQELAGCGAHRRSANRERREAAGEVRLPGQADHDGWDLPSRCQDDWKTSRGLETGGPQSADCGERWQPGLPFQLKNYDFKPRAPSRRSSLPSTKSAKSARSAAGMAPAKITWLLTMASPRKINSPSPPAPIAAAIVARPMETTVAIRIPATMTPEASGNST